MMKIEEIEAIARIMSENDLSEFRIDVDDCKLCMRRGAKVSVAAAVPAVQAAPAAPVVAAPVAAAPVAPAAESAAPEKVESIDSPLVGTFYRATSPGAPALVSVGDKVTPDTVVAIIEAMKVMNEIKAEKTGVIKEVLVENGHPVEYGQPLFVIG